MLKEYKDEASLKAAGKVMTKGKDYGMSKAKNSGPDSRENTDF